MSINEVLRTEQVDQHHSWEAGRLWVHHLVSYRHSQCHPLVYEQSCLDLEATIRQAMVPIMNYFILFVSYYNVYTFIDRAGRPTRQLGGRHSLDPSPCFI